MLEANRSFTMLRKVAERTKKVTVSNHTHNFSMCWAFTPGGRFSLEVDISSSAGLAAHTIASYSPGSMLFSPAVVRVVQDMGATTACM